MLNPMNEQERLKELADFLRTRRAKLSPAQVGLPPGLRRRVTGLRREEVAELAEISVTWYTWLEQSRSVKVSPETLLRITQALQLNRHEQEHLFFLAGHSPPPLPFLAEKQVTESTRQVLKSLEPNPAYLVDLRWNLVAWNQAAILVFGDFTVFPSSERNLMWLAFTNSAMKELFVNWEEFAHCLLVHFRADYAQNANEQSWTELAVALQISPQFRKWWKSHDVARPHEVQELNHPIVGKLVLDSVTFQVYPAANLRLTAYTPKANTDKVKLQKLHSQAVSVSCSDRTCLGS